MGVLGEDDIARAEKLAKRGIVEAIVVGAIDEAHEEALAIARLELVGLGVEPIVEGSTEGTQVVEADLHLAPEILGQGAADDDRRGTVAEVGDVGGGLGPEGEGKASLDEESADAVEDGEHEALDPAVLRVVGGRGEGALDAQRGRPGVGELVEELATLIGVEVANVLAQMGLDQGGDAHDLAQRLVLGAEERGPGLAGGVVLEDEHIALASRRGDAGWPPEVNTGEGTGVLGAREGTRSRLTTSLAHDAGRALEGGDDRGCDDALVAQTATPD